MKDACGSSLSMVGGMIFLALLFSLLAGIVVAGVVMAVIGFLIARQSPRPIAAPPRDNPSITYLPKASPDEPLMTLLPGQELDVPWPYTVQVRLPDGAQLQILEATAGGFASEPPAAYERRYRQKCLSTTSTASCPLSAHWKFSEISL